MIIKIIKFINHRKRGLGYLFYNVTGNFFTLVLNFILPFYLSSEGYGYFALYFAIHNVVISIFTFGLDASIIKFAIEKKSQSNILFTSLLSWLILTIFLLPFILFIFWILSENNIIKLAFNSLVPIIISAAIISFQRIVLSYYIAESSVKKYGKLFIFNKLTQFILILSIVLFFDESKSLNLIPDLILLQGILIFGYISVFIFLNQKERYLKISPTIKELKSLIKFTLPLSINTVGNFGYSYGFNVFISPFLNISQLGILNIFTQFGNISMMALNALNNGYIPTFYKQIKINLSKAVFNYFKYILNNATFIILVIFLGGVIYKFYAYKNVVNYSVVLLIIYLLGILFYSFKSIGSNFLIIENKTFKISIITVITSVSNIVVGILLTKSFGFYGCIISLSLGYIIQVIAFNYNVMFSFLKHRAINII